MYLLINKHQLSNRLVSELRGIKHAFRAALTNSNARNFDLRKQKTYTKLLNQQFVTLLMRQNKCMQRISLFISLSALVLAGCGGGGGDDNTNPESSGIETSSSTSTSTSSISTPPAVTAINTANRTITDANSCALPNYQSEIMATVNAARAAARSCGSQTFSATTPLTWNDKLFAAAALHSLDMAQNNYFEHNSQDGTSFSQRITAAGYTWSAAGENIAAGQPSISSVMQGWLQSPGHCRNIMNPNFKDIAVACVKGISPGSYSKYWTMELASPR